MNLKNALRKLVSVARWILRRIGLDIVRYYPVKDRRLELENQLAVLRDNIIASGPFAGVRLPEIHSWGPWEQTAPSCMHLSGLFPRSRAKISAFELFKATAVRRHHGSK